MTTASTSVPTRTGAGPGGWFAGGLVLLIAGPFLFDLGYALHPSLPGDSAGALAEVVDVREQVAASKVMVAVGGLLIIGLVLTLRRHLVPDRGRALATVGAVLMAIGHAFNALSQATYGYLMFWAGWAVAAWSVWALVPVVVMAGLYTIAARYEEQLLGQSEMGAAYADYRKQAGLFWPKF